MSSESRIINVCTVKLSGKSVSAESLRVKVVAVIIREMVSASIVAIRNIKSISFFYGFCGRTSVIVVIMSERFRFLFFRI